MHVKLPFGARDRDRDLCPGKLHIKGVLAVRCFLVTPENGGDVSRCLLLQFGSPEANINLFHNEQYVKNI